MDFWHTEIYCERSKRVPYCLIFTVVLFYIVNNGNILTDGRNERRHFEGKYNELQFLKNTLIFLNNCYNTNTTYYFYPFNLFLVNFQFLLAQNQYNPVNRHIFGSGAVSLVMSLSFFLKLSRIDDSLIKSIYGNTVLLSGLLVLVFCQ